VRDVDCTSLERRVFDHAARHGLLDPEDGVLLMLSGGPDSMAMLALVRALDRRRGLKLRLGALHVDYGTRGAASTRDRRIVRLATEEAGIPLTELDAGGGIPAAGFQDEARRARWDAARRLAAERGYERIAVGHNLDDRAETVLYRLVKYGAPSALAAMAPRAGMIVRPLLCLHADEIREYCASREIDFGQDETNLREDYARNVIRLSVLPQLRRLNPRAGESLARAAEQACEERELLDGLVEDASTDLVGEERTDDGQLDRWLELGRLRSLPSGLRPLVLRRFVNDAVGGARLLDARTTDSLARLADGSDGTARVSLRDGWEAVREYDRLVVCRPDGRHRCDAVCVSVPTPGMGAARVDFCGRTLTAQQVAGRADVQCAPVVLGSARPVTSLALRHPRVGERFRPLGFPADTTVAGFLREQKVPARIRAQALVVELGGEVAWVGLPHRGTPGGDGAVAPLRGRVAHGFRVTDSTQYTVCLRPVDAGELRGRTSPPKWDCRRRVARGEDETA